MTDELTFLTESNAIEGVYSKEALVDSIKAWEYAKKYEGEINAEFIKRIHKLIMNRLNPRIAGKFRRIQVGVMTKEGFNEAIHWSLITTEIDKLCDNKKYPVDNWLQIKKHHIEFEHIHPFQDGNGRTGRILMNVLLLRKNLPIKIIHQGEEQIKYYKWFK